MSEHAENPSLPISFPYLLFPFLLGLLLFWGLNSLAAIVGHDHQFLTSFFGDW
jgi:hypothetical protein